MRYINLMFYLLTYRCLAHHETVPSTNYDYNYQSMSIAMVSMVVSFGLFVYLFMLRR